MAFALPQIKKILFTTNEIDLVVMGYHARGRLAEAVSGSVSRSVLRNVHVPVLLVKLPEGNG